MIPKIRFIPLAMGCHTDVYIPAHADYEKLSGNKVSEPFKSIRARLTSARDIQNKCFIKVTDIICNAAMRIGEIHQFYRLQYESQTLMRILSSFQH